MRFLDEAIGFVAGLLAGGAALAAMEEGGVLAAWVGGLLVKQACLCR